MKVRVINTFVPKDEKKKVVMYASLLFFDCLEVHNWRLFNGTTGLQVGYPNSPMAVGASKFYRQVVPKTPELQAQIREVMFSAYDSLKREKAISVEEGVGV